MQLCPTLSNVPVFFQNAPQGSTMLPQAMLHINLEPSAGTTVDSSTAYADDTTIISRSISSAKEMYSDTKSAAKMTELSINTNKTIIVIHHWPREQVWNVTTDRGYNENNGHLYVGSKTHTGGDEFHEIKRINLANTTHFSLLPIFKCKYVHQVPKTKLWKTIIKTTLHYGCKR